MHFGSLGLPELLVILPVSIFWVWMLVEAVTKELNPRDRLLWVIILVFTHVIGAVIYLLVRKMPRMLQGSSVIAGRMH